MEASEEMLDFEDFQEDFPQMIQEIFFRAFLEEDFLEMDVKKTKADEEKIWNMICILISKRVCMEENKRQNFTNEAPVIIVLEMEEVEKKHVRNVMGDDK